MNSCSCTLPISCCERCSNNSTADYQDTYPTQYIVPPALRSIQVEEKRRKVREAQKMIDKWGQI